MQYIISFSLFFFLGISSLYSQVIIHEQEVVNKDTVIVKAPLVDSTLLGISVFSLINNKDGYSNGLVVINQPESVTQAFNYYISGNSQKKKSGYRIRIFFDNKQNARWESENIMNTFTQNFPYIPVYRSYSNPYFKVVAGDFRTKSEAMKVLGSIKSYYPSALVIKEQIQFPPL